MKTKKIGFGVAVPLITTALLGFAGSAQAATFGNGDTLNLTTNLQVDFTGFLPLIPDSSQTDGDPFPDIRFDADAGLNGPSPAEAGTAFVTAPLGELGVIATTGANTGAFQELSFPTEGVARSFDQNSADVNSISAIGFFAEIGDFRFSINPPTLNNTTVGGNLPQVDFQAVGQVVRISDPTDIARVEFDFTAQGLFDDGPVGGGGDFLAGDGITGLGSASGTIVARVVDIPEPSSVVSLGALLVFGTLYLRNKQSKENISSNT